MDVYSCIGMAMLRCIFVYLYSGGIVYLYMCEVV